MKKQVFTKKLQLRKDKISELDQTKISGGNKVPQTYLITCNSQCSLLVCETDMCVTELRQCSHQG